MLDSSKLGLIPVHHPNEPSNDFSLTKSRPPPLPMAHSLPHPPSIHLPTLIDDHEVEAADVSAPGLDHLPVAVSNISTSAFSPKSATRMHPTIQPVHKYLRQMTSSWPATAASVTSMSEIPVSAAISTATSSTPRSTSASPTPNAAQQLKRKRGRPRKCTTQDLFPSQIYPSSSSPSPPARINLPPTSAFATTPLKLSPQSPTTTSGTRPTPQATSTTSTTAFLVVQPPPSKKRRTGRHLKPKQAIEFNGIIVGGVSDLQSSEEPNASLYPPQPPASTSASPCRSLITTQTQYPSPPLTMPTAMIAHNGQIETSIPAAAASINGSSLTGSIGTASATATPLISSSSLVTRSPTPLPPALPAAIVEDCLISRLLPQAEAAVCAARAAGLPGPHSWTSQMVADFVATLPGCQRLALTFIENEVDGPALLCLEQPDLILVLKLKLGPAVKVFGAIRALRRTVLSLPMTELSTDQANSFAAAAHSFLYNRPLPLHPAAPSQPMSSTTTSSATTVFSTRNCA